MRLLLIGILLLTGLSAAHAADRRVAVVVGVGAYQAVPQLANPPRDARAIADALRRLGFDTTLVLDPDRAALEQAIRTLGDRAQGADVAMFFYAGHAVEANGRNALVPVSARIARARDLPFETVDLDRVLDQLGDQTHTTLIFLDACRDNPFQRSLAGAGRGLGESRGLAAPSADVTGTLIAFATAPGHVAADGDGADSPFTTALLRHIETPGLELRQMLALVRKDVRLATNGTQIPWESSALEGEFYFRPTAASTATNTQAAASASSPPPHCHVPHLLGQLRHPPGATGTMQVTSDGRGCAFTVWRHAVTREPYDDLEVTTPPRHGAVHILEQRRIVYEPTKSYAGPDSFAVTSTPAGVVSMQVTVTAPATLNK
jgi:hypothetical protein